MPSRHKHNGDKLQISSLFFGTGSYPYLLFSGLQRKNLQRASDKPTNTPRVSIASYAYSEQVGVNLQLFPNAGEMFFL